MNERGTLKMASPIAFDTLAFANKLKAAGADPKLADVQSEATAEILSDLVNSQLATKQDLRDLESRLYIIFFKMISTAVGILGGLQVLFHFLGK